MRTKKMFYVAVGGAIAAFALTSCSQDNKGLGDAPVKQLPDETHSVIVMPDQFPNLAIACDGSTAIFVNTSGYIITIPHSQYCPESRGN